MPNKVEELPSGTLSMLFTDIEGSTRLLHQLGDDYAVVLTEHQRVLSDAIERYHGHTVDTQGDSLFAVFESARDGVAAAVTAQQSLAHASWPRGATVKVRMGLHTGEPRLTDHRYIGLDVHRAARIGAVAHGGQVLLSKETRLMLGEGAVPDGVVVRDLGSYHLKDLRYPEALYDLAISGISEELDPLQPLGLQPNNLSAPPTTIIGRDQEVDDLSELLGNDTVRLVTLTGPGGAGKTRLALQVAHDLLPAFSDGVFQVMLAPISDPDLVATCIARALSVSEFPGVSLVDAVKNRLGERRILLFLDNFEHVIAAAKLLADLLGSCPNLKMLVTSRETLNIRFEREFRVPPLDLPDQADQSIGAITANNSVRLFVDRVKDFDRDFSVTPENSDAIASICQKLDGLPLAIELAASHIKVLTPENLLGRLAHRLDMLAGGKRDHDPRHRSLRDTIDWSFNLLAPEERDLFQTVSIFAGGFGIEAARAVGGALVDPGRDVLAGLAELVKKSLLRSETLSGEPRFVMLETVRDFGLQQLRQTEGYGAVRGGHAAYFAGLVDDMAPHLLGYDQRPSVVRLLDEADNIRAALSWGLEQSNAETISRLLRGMTWLWVPRGHFAEGLSWAARAMEHVKSVGTNRERAIVLDAAGWLMLFAGDYAGAVAPCEESLGLFEDLGSTPDVARTKITSGITKAVTGDVEDGPRLIMEGLGLYRELGDDYGTALALIALGEGARAGGDEQTAARCDEEALDLLRGVGNTYWTAGLLQNLAHFSLHSDRRDEAARYLAEAFEIAEQFNYPMILALCIAATGGLAIARGCLVESAQLFGAASSYVSEIGARFEPTDLAELEGNIGTAREQLGDTVFDEAFAQGVAWSREKSLMTAKANCGER